MTKGHNKDKNNEKNEHKGGEGRLKSKARRKATVSSGRNEDTDQAKGKKGKNSI